MPSGSTRLHSTHRRGALTAGTVLTQAGTGKRLGAAPPIPLQLPFWADAARWNDPQYYCTIQLADIDGDGQAELIGRGPAGVLSNAFDTSRGQWLTLPPGPPISDADGWYVPNAYMTMQTADLDGDGAEELFVLSSTGVQVWKYMTTASSGPGWVGHGTELTAIASYWAGPQYYLTIQAADLDGDGSAELIARGPDGVHVWKFSPAGWAELTTPQTVLPLSDANAWNDAPYYPTLSTGRLDTSQPASSKAVQLFARAADGVMVWAFNGTTWSLLGSVLGLTDAGGWNQPQYFSTIQVADLMGTGYDQLIARGHDGIHVYQFNGTSWNEITTPASVLPLADSAGWNLPQYYSTIQAADIDGDGCAELIARAGDGLQFWKFNGTSWAGTDATQMLTAMSDANGWSLPCYYATIQTAVINKDTPKVSSLIARSSQSIQGWTWNTATGSWDITSVQAYPQFTGDRLAAYQSISQQLGVTSSAGLRSIYDTELMSPLIDFRTTLIGNSLKRPSAISTADWHSVQEELATELEYAANVVNYYQLTHDLINNIFVAKQISVTTVSQTLSIPPKDNTSVFFDVAEVLTNTAWAALGVVAPEASVAAGLLASAFGAMIDAEGSDVNLTAAVAELESQLGTSFSNALTANGNQQSLVVGDWSLFSSIGGMITSGAWNWSPTDSPQYVTAGQYQYQLSLWQTLVPVAWQLWTGTFGPPDGYPREYVYQEPGTYTEYWLLMVGSEVTWKVPATGTFGALFSPPPVGLGVSIADVVNGVNGWTKLPLSYDDPIPPPV